MSDPFFDAYPEPSLEAMTEAYREILTGVLGDLGNGTASTPLRAAKAMIEMTEGYHFDVESLITTFEGEDYDGQIVARALPFASLCEHHMLPFTGRAYIAYIPNDKIIGLSKLPRLLHAYTRRFNNQERIGMKIADALEEHLDPVGVMVLCVAEHTCMSLRGIKSPGEMVTSVTRRLHRTDHKARDEALRLFGDI